MDGWTETLKEETFQKATISLASKPLEPLKIPSHLVTCSTKRRHYSCRANSFHLIQNTGPDQPQTLCLRPIFRLLSSVLFVYQYLFKFTLCSTLLTLRVSFVRASILSTFLFSSVRVSILSTFIACLSGCLYFQPFLFHLSGFLNHHSVLFCLYIYVYFYLVFVARLVLLYFQNLFVVAISYTILPTFVCCCNRRLSSACKTVSFSIMSTVVCW